MECKVISPKKTKNYQEVKSIILPAFLGRMEVLQNHAETFVVLKKGSIVFRTKNNKEEIVPVKEGLFYIKNNKGLVIL